MQLAAFNNNNFNLGPGERDRSTRACRSTWSPGSSSATTCRTMTVGILGMSFKAESDDTRSSLSYKLKRILRFKAARVLTHRSVRARTDPDLVAARRRARATPTCSSSARRTRCTADLEIDVPVVDMWNLLEQRSARVIEPTDPRVGRHPGVQRGRRDRHRASTASSPASRCRARSSWSTTTSDDTTSPALEKYAEADPRVVPTLNTYGRGPARAIRYGIDHVARAGGRGHDGRRQRRRRADRRARASSSSAAW